MSPSIRRMLWGAFGGLALLVAAGVAFTIAVLRMEQRQMSEVLQQSRPFIDAVRDMDDALDAMVSASRAYILNGQTAYTQQYLDAVRAFDKADSQAETNVINGKDRKQLGAFVAHYQQLKGLMHQQLDAYDNKQFSEATAKMQAVAQARRAAPDFAGLIVDRIRNEQNQKGERISNTRQWLMMAVVFFGIGIIVTSGLATWRVEQALRESISRQGRRTEAIVGGMTDGVMLVDEEGRSVFVNPAGQRLLGNAITGVPIFRHSDVYNFRDAHGRLLDPAQLPAAQALSTGKAVQDVTVLIGREENRVAVSMSATPLHEDGRISGVI